MEILKIENVSFKYPNASENTLENINLTVNEGDFVVLFGKSGCGKTTLLRLIKNEISPVGDMSGRILFCGEDKAKADARDIGFVMQDAEYGIVCDKVYKEMAFGLESISEKPEKINVKISETASFFGMEKWFESDTGSLSGGQKQMLCIAAVMVMEPKLLILDEPSSSLDPIAASELFKTLRKINDELGVTIIVCEHRLEELFTYANRAVVMSGGKIISDASASDTAENIKGSDTFLSLPTPVKLHTLIENDKPCPISVKDARIWLRDTKNEKNAKDFLAREKEDKNNNENILSIKNVYFRYEKNSQDILKGFDMNVKRGEIFCLLGANGAGKSTAFAVASGISKPYAGSVRKNGKCVFLMQNTQSVFTKMTLYEDLAGTQNDDEITENMRKRIEYVSDVCDISHVLHLHPHDLSGGEMQRGAIAKALLESPELLLLDEPTRGMDSAFKYEFCDFLKKIKSEGVTVAIITHDVEFCALAADRCAMMFGGKVISEGTPYEMFSENGFYTTSAARCARGIIGGVLTCDDILKAFSIEGYRNKKSFDDMPTRIVKSDDVHKSEKREKKNKASVILFLSFLLLAILQFVIPTEEFFSPAAARYVSGGMEILMLLLLAAAIVTFKTKNRYITKTSVIRRKISAPEAIITAVFLSLVPITIFVGMKYFGDRKYYFISLLIIIETLIPAFASFEKRRPKAREIVTIAFLSALAVCGRFAFFALPQFKPVLALIIISASVFGARMGFLMGAVVAFASNMFFGQGPWTPWQMFSMGAVGFLSGIIFGHGFIEKKKIALCIFGFFSAFILYGAIMNLSSVMIWQTDVNISVILAAYATGLPMDIIHGLATVYFLWFAAEPMIEKIVRIKTKYGLI